jgi:hypothetical protein
LGLVKGGFVVQLCFGLSGCIDTHNLNMACIKPSRVSAARFKKAKSWRTKDNIAREYQEYIQEFGGTETLWDSWCDYVAKQRPKRFASGFEVSQLHCDAIGA